MKGLPLASIGRSQYFHAAERPFQITTHLIPEHVHSRTEADNT